MQVRHSLAVSAPSTTKPQAQNAFGVHTLRPGCNTVASTSSGAQVFPLLCRATFCTYLDGSKKASGLCHDFIPTRSGVPHFRVKPYSLFPPLVFTSGLRSSFASSSRNHASGVQRRPCACRASQGMRVVHACTLSRTIAHLVSSASGPSCSL